jgi:hypothetical protein
MGGNSRARDASRRPERGERAAARRELACIQESKRMETVFSHIAQRKRAYAMLPLFERLRDDSLPARVRLAFMSRLAFFVMAFADLNRYVLRREPPRNPHDARVNAHTREDDHHWAWFLEDLDTLGWNAPTTTTDALRALWREETCRSRILMYELCALLGAADSVERYAIVEAIEATGNVLFALTTRAADQWQAATGRPLRYMGAYHFAHENGHLQRDDEAAALERIALPDDARRRCVDFVDRVFEVFAAWTHEAEGFVGQAAAESDAWMARLSSRPALSAQGRA